MQLTREEIIAVRQAEQQRGCACLFLTDFPAIPLRGKRFELRPHPLCPMHKHQAEGWDKIKNTPA